MTSNPEADWRCQEEYSGFSQDNKPRGLIGPPSMEPIKVNGHPCDALLYSGSEVFSLDALDIGLAKEVEHTIRLSDKRALRERLAPADIDDVRSHLQKLLAVGIIKESRKPYIFPIVVVRKKR